MATASAEGDALLARTGIPARIALIAISVGIRQAKADTDLSHDFTFLRPNISLKS